MTMLTERQIQLIKRAKENKKVDSAIRLMIAKRFHVAYDKINIQRAFEYINYLDSPQAQLESFLDKIAGIK